MIEDKCLICKKEKEEGKIFCKRCYDKEDIFVKIKVFRNSKYAQNHGRIRGRPREKPRNYTERFKMRFGGY